ncbi:MAG TPA: presenilin family intramembrane aspartyl protease [Candidatus Paceibacterota bacterium]|nr:presenilin family intramembrane aspartyl protease [Candidatus Paceibacterota bacterium]
MEFKLKLFLRECALFAPTMALGLFAAYRMLVLNPGMPALKAPAFSLADITLLAAIVALFLAGLRFGRFGRLILLFFFFLIVWAGAEAVFETFVPVPIDLVLSVGCLVLFAAWRSVLVHDLVVGIALAGLGAAIGISIMPSFALVALIVLSFYDIIAVYQTGHMVRMAQGMIQSGVIFGFLIPEETKLFLAPRRQAHDQIGAEFMILGSGDIALPIVFAASIARESIVRAGIVAGFAVIGIFVTHVLFINQRQRRAMAALPPIATLSIIGYVLTILFF